MTGAGRRRSSFTLRPQSRCCRINHEGQLRIVRWGCRRRGESYPSRGWLDEIGHGGVGLLVGERCRTGGHSGALGLDGGVWYAIRQGVRGVLVKDERGVERVYVVCEPASHYYAVMTRSAWMPVLIGERI